MDWNHTQLITKIDNNRGSFNCTLLLPNRINQIKIFKQRGKKCQHALKGNVVNFPQDPKSVVKLLDILPLSLESLSDIVVVHFVGSPHPPI
jgi:hypothetical protein